MGYLGHFGTGMNNSALDPLIHDTYRGVRVCDFSSDTFPGVE